MLADQLQRVGASLDEVRRGLDFGCSSGRVVRALAAAFPQAEWHGVDPNERRDRVGAASIYRGSGSPCPRRIRRCPTPTATSTSSSAISIWSHYAEPAALRWLDEMHRVIAPGGHLAFSTHGPHSVSYYAQTAERSPAQLAPDPRARSTAAGYWFAPEFGESGDWGVKHLEWGTAFFTPEWVGAHGPAGVVDRGLRRRPERRQPGHVRPAPALTLTLTVVAVQRQ